MTRRDWALTALLLGGWLVLPLAAQNWVVQNGVNTLRVLSASTAVIIRQDGTGDLFRLMDGDTVVWSVADGGAMDHTGAFTNTGAATVTSLALGTDGVTLTHDSDGAVTITGNGNGTDEDVTLNLDDTSNTAVWTTSTGVTSWLMPWNLKWTDNQADLGADGATRPQDIFLAGFLSLNRKVTATVDGATTFAVTSSYTVLACTGTETIDTITGGVTGVILYLENTDTECTINDDDTATAANAVDLTGTATGDVGALKKVITLLYNGTDWVQIAESDN